MANIAVIAVIWVTLSLIVTACAVLLIRRGERNQQRDYEDPRIWEFSFENTISGSRLPNFREDAIRRWVIRLSPNTW